MFSTTRVTPLLEQLLLTTPGPKDTLSSSSTILERFDSVPYPPGPNFWPSPLNEKTISTAFHDWSLQAWVPISFAIVYYIVAHTANHYLVGKHKTNTTDYSKGSGIVAATLRWLIIAHNAFLAVYSGWTFYHLVPVVAKFFAVGYQAAGFEGIKLALCSMPINTVTLAPYTWLFYISKYYEVVDSMILVIKGKPVSNLQSYHHAGALLAMWIAYRFQSQAVWVFVTFNSGVHTAMYAYYFCSAMKLPFPKALKRNLTTLQIAQITSGCLLTNLYWITVLKPTSVMSGLTKLGFNTAIKQPTLAAQNVLHITSTPAVGLELFQLASQRAASSLPGQCLESTGATVALHFNTAYLLPLVVLFTRFFIRSYVKQRQGGAGGSARGGAKQIKTAEREAEADMANLDHPRANGNGKSSAVKANGGSKRR